MRSIWLTLAFVLILVSSGCRSAAPRQAEALPPPVAEVGSYPNLMAQAKELETALTNKDYAKVLDLTNPKVVEVGGGREKLLAAMQSEMKSIEAGGVTLLSSTASPPSQFVSDANGIYAVVPVTTKIKAQEGIFQTEGSLVGVSTDGGQNWTFVDATGKDQTELKKVLPILDKLNLPPEKPPVKVANN
jgi:hypothetical protein